MMFLTAFGVERSETKTSSFIGKRKFGSKIIIGTIFR